MMFYCLSRAGGYAGEPFTIFLDSAPSRFGSDRFNSCNINEPINLTKIATALVNNTA